MSESVYPILGVIMTRYDIFNNECYSKFCIGLKIPYDNFLNAYLISTYMRMSKQTAEQAWAEIQALVFMGFCSKMNLMRNRLGFYEE